MSSFMWRNYFKELTLEKKKDISCLKNGSGRVKGTRETGLYL